jgi:hypothetical protein
MASSKYNMISNREEVDKLFQSFGDYLDQRIQIVVIGGAALLEYGLKDITKDIDLVCRCEDDKTTLLECAKRLGFELAMPEKRHARLGLNRIAIKGRHTLDIFAKKISSDFGLTESMWSRASQYKALGNIELKYASKEDIFILKMIANREGDIGDCANLVAAGLDYDTIYAEIELQYDTVDAESGMPEVNQKIWITYIDEAVGKLEDIHGMSIPIADKISSLADNCREMLEQELASTSGHITIRE